MPFTHVAYPGLPPEPSLDSMLDLLTGIFDDQSRDEWRADLTRKAAMYPAFQTLLALDGERVVGCKLGYEWRSESTSPTGSHSSTFYSWLGGVHPAYRGSGIARVLMTQQHEACRAAGYTTVRTHTYNRWREMLILNLRHGFDVVGTQPGKHGLTIMMEKVL